MTFPCVSMIAAQAQGGQGGFPMDLVLMILLIFMGYYFLILMPQKRERAERQKMLDSLRKGDRVVTTAGIHGKVVDLVKRNEGDVATLECSRNVQIDFSRSAIAMVVKRKDGGDGGDEGADEGPSKSSKGKEKRG